MINPEPSDWIRDHPRASIIQPPLVHGGMRHHEARSGPCDRPHGPDRDGLGSNRCLGSSLEPVRPGRATTPSTIQRNLGSIAAGTTTTASERGASMAEYESPGT